MNILIVDDEVQTVRAIKHSIDWKKLNIEGVFTEYNIEHAKKIMSEERVDIVICDIEMPQGSGLELLQWIKENTPETESILLTCHAEFEFAKKAIELGSFDYLVKPIPFATLEQVIINVISKINSYNNLKKYSKYGEYWINNQARIEEGFWSELLRGNIYDNPSAVAQDAEKRNIDYKLDEEYLLILICKKRLVTRLNNWDNNLLNYALKNIASEIILEDLNSSSVFIFNDQVVVILPSVNNRIDFLDRIKICCKECILFSNKYLGCSVSCYIGNYVFGEQLSDIYSKLSAIDKDNVALTSKTFDLNEGYYEEEFVILQSTITEWTSLLYKGEMEDLKRDMIKYINSLAVEGRLNVEVLSIFQQDVLQLVYSFLEKKDVQAHQFFKDTKSQELYKKSTSSVDNIISWINYFIDKAIGYVEEITKSKSVIGKVKEYIKNNLHNDITRDDIANYVFLNADYLTRIFKRSTGLSLNEYLTEQRIQKSINMLLNSETPISDIAADVGYDNLTYFSKTFKKIIGNTPSEYRKKYKKSEIL